MTEGAADKTRRDHTRRNFVALGLDYGGYLIGMSFASQATILPAFAAHLGASNLVIGAIPAVMTLGWFMPSLFAARHTEALPRKLPFILRYTIWERVSLPALAAVAFFVAEPAPRLTLVIVLLLLLGMTGVSGALIPAWMDVIARTIPTTLRGRFFGAANLLASVGGLLGSAATAYLLAAFPPPASYGLCFLAGSVFLALSYFALASAREPAAATTRTRVPLGAYLRRIPALLRRDRNLFWFLVARAVTTLGAMGNGFYTVYALRAYAAPDWQVGVFTSLYLAGQMMGNLALGWLADRVGHRIVLVVGVASLAAGNVAALVAPSVQGLGPVFLLSGVHLAAIHLSARTILLELADDPDERPTYIGLANTALAPLSFATPLAGGLLADRFGFPTVFAVAASFGLVALVLLLGRVREPRRAPATRER
jgi:MFS family permease